MYPPMHDIGETTQDIRALGQNHPAEKGLKPSDRETGIRRWGNRALAAGIALPVFVYGGTLIAAVLADISVFTSAAGQLFAVLGTIALIGLSASLLTFACLERLTRQSRTLIRRAVVRADNNALLADANRQANEDTKAAVEKATDDAMDKIEQNNRLTAEVVMTVAALQADMAAVLLELKSMQERLDSVPQFGQGFELGAKTTASVLGLDKG